MDLEQRTAVLDLSDHPEPRTEDVASPEAVVQAVYQSISGPPEVEEERDWDRLRALFLPDARFVIVRWQPPGGEEEKVLRAWDVEGFIEAARGFYRESSFYEHEIAAEVDRFGHVAHVFSTYESRMSPDDDEPVARGINSVQVVRAEDRWWIAHLIWDVETPGNPIPEAYLRGKS